MLLFSTVTVSFLFSDAEEVPVSIIDPAVQIEQGGIVIRREAKEQAYYLVTYLYDDHIWGRRISKEGKFVSRRPVKFLRWEMNQGGWGYIPAATAAELIDPSIIEPVPAKRFTRRPLLSSESAAVVAKSDFESATSFLQVGNTLYGADPRQDRLLAVDLATGRLDPSLWEDGIFKNPDLLKGPSAMTHVGTTLFVVGSQSHNVVAIDLRTGEPDRKSWRGGVFKDENVLKGPSAILQVGDNLLVAGTLSNTVVAIGIERGTLNPGLLGGGVLRHGSVSQPSAIVHIGNTLYVAGFQSNIILAADLDSARPARGKFENGVFRDESILQGPSAMIHIGDTIYVIGTKSSTIVAINPATGGLDRSRFSGGVYRSSLGPKSPAAFLTIGDVVYVVDSQKSTLLAIDRSTGDPVPGLAVDPDSFSRFVRLSGGAEGREADEAVVILPIETALRRHAELAPQMPFGASAAVFFRSLKIHGSAAAAPRIARLRQIPSPELAAADLQFVGPEGLSPYGILVVDTGAEPPPAPSVPRVAVVDLKVLQPTGFQEVLASAVSQWGGGGEAAVVGSGRLKDGRSVLFIGSPSSNRP
ncbi:MAG: PQQ-like beta-propeller repeat protein [Candidatus Omnitrophica bacterium]|nr:PQQ-like beta-propeller repeat protein [Candidatus Omnitrophota bacterium]